MDRNQQPAASSLLDREGRIVAEILERYRNMMLVSTARITNRANTGQAAYNSMHMDIETRGLIKSIEELLSLTRQLRELWVVGPLRKPGEAEKEAEATIDTEVRAVVELLNARREQSRQDMMGANGTYITAALEPPKLESAQPIPMPGPGPSAPLPGT